VTDLNDTLSTVAGDATDPGDIAYRQGYVIEWNSDNHTNLIRVRGSVISNVPVLTSAGMISIAPGSTVAMIKTRTQYFILGRVVAQDTNFINPQFPLVLYPQFVPPGTPGNAEFFRGNAGQFVGWGGMTIIAHPQIVVSGLFGAWTGTNTTTYTLRVDGNDVGSWTETTAVGPIIRGPFDVSQYIGTTGFFGTWNAIDLVVTATSGTGTYLFQLYGCFFEGY
jgi:hypothetical protein